MFTFFFLNTSGVLRITSTYGIVSCQYLANFEFRLVDLALKSMLFDHPLSPQQNTGGVSVT